jgi:polar amino acid transport system substrate-binding protein
MDRSRSLRRGVTALGVAALMLAAGAVAAEPPTTIEPGKLNVALNGDMPMTGLEDDKLIGTDGDLMVLIADRLGLEVVPHMMEWSAEIQSTKQGKVDIMHGAMGWIEPRSEIMLLTDPIYYFGTFLAQKQDTSWSTFEDMKGRSVATVSGFTLVPELKEVEGIGEVKLYDTTDGACLTLGKAGALCNQIAETEISGGASLCSLTARLQLRLASANAGDFGQIARQRHCHEYTR